MLNIYERTDNTDRELSIHELTHTLKLFLYLHYAT